jgi:hypothetical protein
MKILISINLLMTILGGIVIILHPDHWCIKCSIDWLKAIGIAEVISGISAVVVATRLQKGLR